MARKRYDDEFRKQAIDLVLNEKLPVARVSRDLGVNKTTLHSWVDDARREGRTPQGETPEQELKRLRKEVRVLQEEREILKKAAAFFAKESK